MPASAPAKSSREERKEREKEKERMALAPGVISAEEIRARMPLEKEMEWVVGDRSGGRGRAG